MSSFENLFVSVDKEDPNDYIIELDNIQKTYLLGIEGVPALRGVNLKIKRGEYVVIYGTSGGGKTSMLNIIGTIDKPTKGHLTICGERITSNTKDETLATLRLKRMGFVFQTFNLLSTMTALENVEMPMILQGNSSKGFRTERAKQLLEKVGMGHRIDHLPSQLSGGEQQRVTIARAISNHPEILLLDEPTGDLDTKNTINVMDLLLKLNEEDGITMVMVTHDEFLKNAADRVVYMRDGKIHRIEEVDPQAKINFRKSIAEKNVELFHHHNNSGNSGQKKKTLFTAATVKRRAHDYETYDKDALIVAQNVLDQFGKRKNLYEEIPSNSNLTVTIQPGVELSNSLENTIQTVNPVMGSSAIREENIIDIEQ
ncbi:hypothetical protein ABK040_000088 [Willaertia magna]